MTETREERQRDACLAGCITKGKGDKERNERSGSEAPSVHLSVTKNIDY